MTVMSRPIRIAARALILVENRLLMVNAFRSGTSTLWCAPGGGAEPHASLKDNLSREIMEETGLQITVGEPALINEFHDQKSNFHQVDVYFRCTALNAMPTEWSDPENVVSTRRFFGRSEMAKIRYKPDSLVDVAWGSPGAITYDTLEPLVR